jgi:uroporphyrin-III C-methyltransferase
MHSKLTLVGAGPGDSELITLKGINALQSADVVLYDALANDTLLEYAPKEAIKINVGKRKGQHSFKQHEINSLIVELALEHGHVVRLKGGDPFIFGRGYEELEHAKAFGILAEVIPGVSSSIGIAATVQIPITHRDIARSFWVFTGHTSDGSLPKDLELAAQSSATVVVLMGMGKLAEIVAIFDKHGKANLPVAIIQNGTTGEQKSVFGQINDIVEKVNESKVSNPAVIIVGDVVGLHPEYMKAYVAEMKL